jgi:uncharacterized membrane-anchored protein YitT (DUF2179 family)
MNIKNGNTMKMILKILWNLFLIFAGSVLCAIALKGILVPKQFMAGGLTGLSLLIHYALPALPLGLIYFLLNIPLFVIGWQYIGRRFCRSVAGPGRRPCSRRTWHPPGKAAT